MQLFVNIIVLASIYALIACGYVMIYRVSRVLNLAHGVCDLFRKLVRVRKIIPAIAFMYPGCLREIWQVYGVDGPIQFGHVFL